MAVPSVRIVTEGYVERDFGRRFKLVRYVVRILVRIFVGTERGPELGTKNPFWYAFWNGIPVRKNNKKCRFSSDFFEIGIGAFIFSIFRNFTPYQVPYTYPVRFESVSKSVLSRIFGTIQPSMLKSFRL